MILEITIPSPGESINEVELANWLVEDGDYVERDQEIGEVESDKATLPLIAEKAGKIKILIKTGETVKIGTVACTIDTSAKRRDEAKVKDKVKDREGDMAVNGNKKEVNLIEKEKAIVRGNRSKSAMRDKTKGVRVTPLAQKMMDEHNLKMEDILQGLKKITTREVNMILEQKNNFSTAASKKSTSREVTRESISQLRKKLSRRLVSVKNETAMLTTFNEVNMSEIIRLRKEYQQQFIDTHGVKLGFMSFFIKASTEALKAFPKVNSMIDSEEIVMPHYVDISIAVQTDKGLMVPVLRNTETMSLAEMEKNILELAEKARNFRLSIEEMSGGTFSITNGGVFGSMLSTPILNPPQSAILGMHNIVERPVAVHGKVEIRPVMYVALSYDHRLIDGKDSVSFLVKVKELLESPQKMLLGGQDPERLLLGI